MDDEFGWEDTEDGEGKLEQYVGAFGSVSEDSSQSHLFSRLSQAFNAQARDLGVVEELDEDEEEEVDDERLRKISAAWSQHIVDDPLERVRAESNAAWEGKPSSNVTASTGSSFHQRRSLGQNLTSSMNRRLVPVLDLKRNPSTDHLAKRKDIRISNDPFELTSEEKGHRFMEKDRKLDELVEEASIASKVSSRRKVKEGRPGSPDREDGSSLKRCLKETLKGKLETAASRLADSSGKSISLQCQYIREIRSLTEALLTTNFS